MSWYNDISNSMQQVTSAIKPSSFGWSNILDGFKSVSKFASDNKSLIDFGLDAGKFYYDRQDAKLNNEYAKKTYNYNKYLTDRTISREDKDDLAISSSVSDVFKKKKSLADYQVS